MAETSNTNGSHAIAHEVAVSVEPTEEQKLAKARIDAAIRKLNSAMKKSQFNAAESATLDERAQPRP